MIYTAALAVWFAVALPQFEGVSLSFEIEAKPCGSIGLNPPSAVSIFNKAGPRREHA
jgi:hypothetical protein